MLNCIEIISRLVIVQNRMQLFYGVLQINFTTDVSMHILFLEIKIAINIINVCSITLGTFTNVLRNKSMKRIKF